ncbi:hypothetical protein KXX29_006866 [Aspergillus fumigatus]|nr:hypothetical protein KXX29_006866 [Aspergillus fumigatus]
MDDKEYGTDAERAELISRIKFDLALLRFLLAQHASQLSDQSVGHPDDPPPPYTEEQGQVVPSTEVTIPSIPSGRSGGVGNDELIAATMESRNLPSEI